MDAMGHMALGCRDKLAMEKFYTDLFGFRRARVFNPGAPDEFVVLRLGGMCIELFPTTDAPTDATGGEQAIGFRHLAFTVANLEEKIEKLHAAGIETDEIEDCNHMAPGLRVCFFRDPDGNILEIMDGWSDEENPPAAP